MNKMLKKIGVVVVTVAAFGLIACDENSTSPAAPDSEIQEPQNPEQQTPSSSETAQPPASSEANQQPESSSDNAEGNSSSDDVVSSSSSQEQVNSSSSELFTEKCIDMDRMCPKCDGPDCPVTVRPCNACEEEGLKAADCSDPTITYVCLNRYWIEDGVSRQKPYCMDIAPTPCRGLEEGCGYRLCDPNGPQEATDCGNQKVYVCENGMWELKNNEETCPPGGDCDGDGIPDGVRRLDLEPCEDGAAPLEFYGRSYVCQDNKWVYAPAPDYDDDSEIATDVSAMHRGGPAVTPRVVKVLNSNGTVTFRDDDVLVNDRCTFTGLKAKISNDTLYAVLLYPECSETGGSMGVATFTLSETFAGAKYIKYKDGRYVHEIYETDELLPCGNTSSCRTCGEGLDCGGLAW